MKRWKFGLAALGVFSATALGGAVVAGATATADKTGQAATSAQQNLTKDQRAVQEALAAPRISVVDRSGRVRGTVAHDAYWGEPDAQGAILIPVLNASGKKVGYYGNFVGFLETAVAEAPAFDQLKHADGLGVGRPRKLTGPTG